MNILIAEDDSISRHILTANVTKWGYNPIAVADGRAALKQMQQDDPPQLALLDWEMPEMNGLEVCQRVRQANSSSPSYIIILTGRSDAADIVRGLDAGANDYVSKPFNNDELHARIRTGKRMVDLQNELLAAKNALAHTATHDCLTGILNREGILDRLAIELERSRRNGKHIAIGLCDIDHFKQVNDTYGHQIGDAVLCGFSATIKNALRPYDAIGRFGGEEFLIIAPDYHNSETSSLFERLRARVEEQCTSTSADNVSVTVSIGVVVSDGHTAVDNLLATADKALYKAKNAGRNRVVFSRLNPA